MRWQDVEQLKKSAPDLKWNKWLATCGTFLSMRVDQKPFDDIRVRRAHEHGGQQGRDHQGVLQRQRRAVRLSACIRTTSGYFQPLNEQPASVQELFKYDPAKAKKLLAEAGYPNGFTFKAQVCSCNPDHMDLLPLISGLSRAGRRQDGNPADGVRGVPVGDDHADATRPGYFMNNGHTNPTTTIRKSFVPARCGIRRSGTIRSSTARWRRSTRSADEAKRQADAAGDDHRDPRQGAVYLAADAVNFTAWWPWVKGYEGELRAGAVRPGPIYARIWVDQELKKKMGY